MALSVAHREHLERLIECAVCMDLSEDPRRLPCGHSFCFTCLQGLWNSSQPTSKIRCPQCRKDHWLGYDGPKTIPKDFIIDQLKEMLQTLTNVTPNTKRETNCEFCLKGFSANAHYLYCLECDSLICSSCSQKHRCSKDTTSNIITLDFQYSLICNNHQHPVRYICDECNSVLCKRCQVQGVCVDHDLFDVFLGKFINDDENDESNEMKEKKAKRQPKCKLMSQPKFNNNILMNSSSGTDKVVQKDQKVPQKDTKGLPKGKTAKVHPVTAEVTISPGVTSIVTSVKSDSGKTSVTPLRTETSPSRPSNMPLRPSPIPSRLQMAQSRPENTAVTPNSTPGRPDPVRPNVTPTPARTQNTTQPQTNPSRPEVTYDARVPQVTIITPQPRVPPLTPNVTPKSTPYMTSDSTPRSTPHATPQLSERPPSHFQTTPVVPPVQLSQPWNKDLSTKGRGVLILPSGDYAMLTEKAVYLITKEGNQVYSYNDIEDPWGLAYWSQNGAIVVTERRARRLSVLTVHINNSLRRLKYARYVRVTPKSCSAGLLSLFRSPDAGPMAIASMTDGGLVITTARVSGEAVTYLDEIIVYNVSGREQYRWHCDPPAQGVTSINSYIYLSMRNCIQVYTPDGSKLQEIGDKPLMFDPGCLCLLGSLDLLVAHRKSYICDDYSIWRISKWNIHGQKQGHLEEISEIENGPIMGIATDEKIILIITEKNVFCKDLKNLRLKRF